MLLIDAVSCIHIGSWVALLQCIKKARHGSLSAISLSFLCHTKQEQAFFLLSILQASMPRLEMWNLQPDAIGPGLDAVMDSYRHSRRFSHRCKSLVKHLSRQACCPLLGLKNLMHGLKMP